MLPESAKSVRLGVGARPPALFSAVFTGRGIEMKYTMRPKRLAVLGTAAVCLLLGLTACSQKPETAALQNDDALLTVDGCAVTEDLIYGYFTAMQPGQSFAYALHPNPIFTICIFIIPSPTFARNRKKPLTEGPFKSR